jgi:hypothetical protein
VVDEHPKVKGSRPPAEARGRCKIRIRKRTEMRVLMVQKLKAKETKKCHHHNDDDDDLTIVTYEDTFMTGIRGGSCNPSYWEVGI